MPTEGEKRDKSMAALGFAHAGSIVPALREVLQCRQEELLEQEICSVFPVPLWPTQQRTSWVGLSETVGVVARTQVS